LNYLDISRNKIESLDESIHLLTKLEHLNISFNSLKKLPVSFGSLNLKHLITTENPWIPTYKELFSNGCPPRRLDRLRKKNSKNLRKSEDSGISEEHSSAESCYSFSLLDTEQANSYVMRVLRDLHDLHSNIDEACCEEGDGVSYHAPSPPPENIEKVQRLIEERRTNEEIKLRKRQKIIEEIISSEETYFSSLSSVVEIYINPLRNNRILSSEELFLLFSNLESLVLTVSKRILEELNEARDQKLSIGDVFSRHGNYFSLYSVYINNFEESINTLNRLKSQKKVFQNFCKQAESNPLHSLPDLQYYLIMPVQRIPRYKLLLEDLLRNTPKNSLEFDSVSKALNEVKSKALEINEKVIYVF
jgi:Leucine-rich repeat (LRR) protein